MDRKRRLKDILQHWQWVTVFLVVYDIAAIFAAYFFALMLRFDMSVAAIPAQYMGGYMRSIWAYTVISLIVFWVCRLYRSIWRFASFNELVRIVIATVITLAVNVVWTLVLGCRMPVSYYVFGIVMQFLAVVAVRFMYRFVLLLRSNRRENGNVVRRVMLIGAGNAGQMIARDIQRAKEVHERVYCFIDDNPNKKGRYIDGIPVVGGRDEILSACQRYSIERIYLTVASATAEQRRDLLNICKETGCELKALPALSQLITGELSVKALKDVAVEDLLGRETIKVNMDEIFAHIKGKVCMVTGGGGSIGSELARQLAAHQPKTLILFDIYENNVYDVQQELRKKYPDLDLKVLIGSCRDSRRLWDVFGKYRPELVYHAAAHKHVPLMEDSPCEAIKNNAIGTYKTAYAAMVHGCKRFVLVSTDKAVNPTNVMGASKRICEMVIQAFAQKVKDGRAEDLPQLFTHPAEERNLTTPEIMEALRTTTTEFVAVRFGNVLGSSGSVIPLFKRQIAEGGPVTVTHPDIIRYFMTIPEAVSLILQAGTYAHGGEIFVLDMGEPVKIDTLARNLIKLSGLQPDVDIEIKYTGLRPGEKLYEEKLMSEEGLRKTENALIHIGSPIPFDIDHFLNQMEMLMDVAYKNKENIRDYVKEVVSTYHPA